MNEKTTENTITICFKKKKNYETYGRILYTVLHVFVLLCVCIYVHTEKTQRFTTLLYLVLHLRLHA